ncbi:MAG: hypothetical protein K0S65_6758 [Labilithrix sp.]|nr:hypothetical protein [Labilithrix sp.]
MPFVSAACVALLVAACGQAPPNKAATSSRLARPFRPGPYSVVCRGPSRLSSALADGRITELRQSCIDGEPTSCSALAQQDPPVSADAELARKRLRQLCDSDRAASSRSPNDPGLAHDRICSCGQFALALLYDEQRRFDEQGLELADEACVAGLLDACDVTALMADLCNLRPAPICAELRAQGRVDRGDDALLRRCPYLDAAAVGSLGSGQNVLGGAARRRALLVGGRNRASGGAGRDDVWAGTSPACTRKRRSRSPSAAARRGRLRPVAPLRGCSSAGLASAQDPTGG